MIIFRRPEMKRLFAMVVLTAIVSSSFVACGVAPHEIDLNKSKSPTADEIKIAEEAAPKGLKLTDTRRIDTDPPFVFAGYSDGQFKLQLKIFQFDGSKLVKTLESPIFDGEQINFNADVIENPWGKSVDGLVVLPVSIYMGGNDWSRNYNKIFTVKDGQIVELPVKCEPGTVAGAMLTDENRLVLPVYDCRFQFFNDFVHAISPSRVYIFDLNDQKDAFVNVTSKHLTYIKKVIDEVKKQADENMTDPQIQASSMVSVYAQAEAGSVAQTYMPMIKELMERFPGDETVKKTWGQIQDSFVNRKPFSTFAPWGDEMDYRWKPFEMKELDK